MKKHSIHLAAGLLIGGVCVTLALRGVDFAEMARALAHAQYGYVLLAVGMMLVSHYLRAWRWRYLLAPVKIVNIASLFAALMIGYAANSFVPAHLGEVLRAYVVGKKHGISSSATLASIVVERIVDVMSLIALMGVVLFVHPFPDWVVQSGTLMLTGAALLLAALVALKRGKANTSRLLQRVLRPLPQQVSSRLIALIETFLSGVAPLQSGWHYLTVAVLSAAIWLCYAGIYYACLQAFHLTAAYHLAWYVGLVVLVLTTISVVIPSTPGYVGTYHYLCQVALLMFGVPAGEALSFAIVAHALSVLPVTLLGLVLANCEGVAIYRTSAGTRKPSSA
ncbi:MAG: flippase-like domain-containing protein [Deltaproteobacteria bacterium]|nr:flippase-like domain-containing protein [Deltaproteobacteria bacterium]